MVVYKTPMEEIPKSCVKCSLVECQLPLRRGSIDTMYDKYTKKRHENCPLIVVEENTEK